MPHPEHVEIGRLRLFREPAWILRLTIDSDRSYLKVKVVRAAPLSHPTRYICLLDAKDEEICMIDDLKQLDREARALIEEELDRRYLTAAIQRVNAVRNEYGTLLLGCADQPRPARVRRPERLGKRPMARRPPAADHRRGRQPL